MTEYAFVYFENKDDEMDFYKKHGEEIIDIMIRCFAPEDEYDKIKSTQMFHSIFQSSRSQWFFVMSTDMKELVAFCKLKQIESVREANVEVETYKVFTVQEYPGFKSERKNIGPGIDALCKRSGYKNAGAFLLQNMHQHLKDIGVEKVYLVPESMRSKEAYDGYEVGYNCKFEKKYFEDNQRLIGFYKKMGYEILPKTYVFERCDISSEFVAYNVMMFDMTKLK